jgi:hypothetical protein
MIKNPEPIIQSIPADVNGTVRYSLVGAFTPEQQALLRKRTALNIDKCRKCLQFLKDNNVVYKANENSIDEKMFDTLNLDDFIIDRTDASENIVNPKLVRLMQFGISSYNTGTTEESIPPQNDVDDGEDVENNRAHMIFQPLLTVGNKSITDVIAFNTNKYPTSRGLANFLYAFPTLFPFGVGGFQEERLVHMTPMDWVLRCLNIYGNRFSKHFGFLAAAFDVIATHKAYSSQFVSMRLKKASIAKCGILSKNDIIECIKYTKEAEAIVAQGRVAPPQPDKIKDLLSSMQQIKPGMASMYGSDASRASARNVGFGLSSRMGDGNIFATISPDNAGSYIIGINTSDINDPLRIDVSLPIGNILPNRNERKKYAATDPFQSALYGKRVNDVFIEVFLGWDLELKSAKKTGGALGFVEWFQCATEAQQCSDLHWHYIIKVAGIPKTTADLHAKLKEAQFLENFIAYVEGITPPHPPLTDISNLCPKTDCKGKLESSQITGEAYRMRKHESSPVETSFCDTCNAKFKHKDVLRERIEAYAHENHINIDPIFVDQYRCSPPSFDQDGELTPTELVYLVLTMLELQFHHETHTKSCFKKTSRTPNAWICRFLFPKLANSINSYIDPNTGEFICARAIGSEYYNICSLLWMRIMKSNMDLQFTINGEGRVVTAYTLKYCFKAQSLESTIIMKISLLSKAYINTLAASDNDLLTNEERGRRFINKALWHMTKPQELHLTLAAFALINDGLFICSHEIVYVNISNVCACFREENSKKYCSVVQVE